MAAGLEPERLADAHARHAQEVGELRGRLAGACPGRELDDLFLLRYVLSYKGGGPSAAAAAAQALAWREEHKGLVAAARACTDELASDPLREWISPEHLRVIDSCLVARFAGQTSTPQGFPVYVIHSGRCKLRELMDAVDIESVALWLTWRNEVGYWRCDAATRQSGLLVKQVVVMSMEGSLMSEQDPRFFVSYGKSSKRAECLHPQLLARQVVVHPPAYMSFFWALGRRLMSERMLAKVHVHSGPPEEHLREYFGGGALPAPLFAALCLEAGSAAQAGGGAPACEQLAATAPRGAPPLAARAGAAAALAGHVAAPPAQRRAAQAGGGAPACEQLAATAPRGAPPLAARAGAAAALAGHVAAPPVQRLAGRSPSPRPAAAAALCAAQRLAASATPPSPRQPDPAGGEARGPAAGLSGASAQGGAHAGTVCGEAGRQGEEVPGPNDSAGAGEQPCAARAPGSPDGHAGAGGVEDDDASQRAPARAREHGAGPRGAEAACCLGFVAKVLGQEGASPRRALQKRPPDSVADSVGSESVVQKPPPDSVADSVADRLIGG